MSVNKVIILGNVCKDPQIRTMNNNSEVATFTLATSERWKAKDTGEKKEKSEFHRVVCYSKGLVGIIKQYVFKGSKLYIEGKLQTRKWTDKQGIEKYSTEIVLQGYNCTLQMVGGKKSTGEQVQNAFKDSKVVERDERFDERIDDDIPFN